MRSPWLVTGATGRIGSALVEELKGQGLPVRALCLPGDDRAVMLDRMGVEVVIGDLAEPTAVNRAVAGAVGVYHLGAALTTRGADVSTIVRSISIGTFNVVDAIRQLGMSALPLLLVSSTSVYYDQSVAPPAHLVTELAPVRASTPYGAAKHSAELVLQSASRAGLVEGVIVRPADTATVDELIEPEGVFGRRWFVSSACRFYREHGPGTFGRLDDTEYSQLSHAHATLYVGRDEHGHEARIQIADATAVSRALVRSMDRRAAGDLPVLNLVAGRVWPIRSVVERIADRLRIAHEGIVTVESPLCTRQWLFGSVRGGRLVGGDAATGL